MDPEENDVNAAPAEAPTEPASDAMEDLIRFDPFAGEPAAAAEPSTEGSEAPTEGGEPAPQAPTEPEKAPAEPVSGKEDAEVVYLRNTLRDVLSTSRGEQAPPSPQQEAKPKAEPAPQAADDIPAHMYTMPPDLIEAMGSEDPGLRSQATSQLVSGVMRTMEKVMRDREQALTDRLTEAIMGQVRVQQTSEQSQKQAQDDFYTVYPQLKGEQYQGYLGQLYQKIAQEQPELVRGGWNHLLRDELGKRALEAFGIKQEAAPAAAPAASHPQLAPARGSRPQQPKMDDQQAQLAAMFGA